MLYILGESPLPLLAYCTGPKLLITPSNSGSCDAWFLWTPEAINTEMISRELIEPVEISSDEGQYMHHLVELILSSSVCVHVKMYYFLSVDVLFPGLSAGSPLSELQNKPISTTVG